ncbi:MAG: hypothetical protein AAFQ87_27780 [Bacteroidota bacterium]
MKKTALVLMIASIVIMGTQIFLTARSESNDYFYLLPLGLCLLVIGLIMWVMVMRKSQSQE